MYFTKKQFSKYMILVLPYAIPPFYYNILLMVNNFYQKQNEIHFIPDPQKYKLTFEFNIQFQLNT